MFHFEKQSLTFCPKLMRNFILLINGLLVLVGLGIVGIGVWMYNSDTIELAGEEFAIVILCLGGVVAIIGLFGFLSACKQWMCGLWVFALLLSFIICCELGLLIYAFSSRNASESFLRGRWEGLNEQSKVGFQNQFDCCGWDESLPGDNCPEDVPPDDYCWQFIKVTVDNETRILIFVGVGVVVLEVIMLIFTVSLRYEVKVARLSTLSRRSSNTASQIRLSQMSQHSAV